MSKITREEAIKIKEIIDDNTEFGYTDWKVVCASIDNIITQQPQLSEDVHDITREESLIDLNNLRSLINETHISRDKKYFANEFIVDIEQRIKALASEIDRFKKQLNAIREVVEDYDINDVQMAQDYMQLIIRILEEE